MTTSRRTESAPARTRTILAVVATVVAIAFGILVYHFRQGDSASETRNLLDGVAHTESTSLGIEDSVHAGPPQKRESVESLESSAELRRLETPVVTTDEMEVARQGLRNTMEGTLMGSIDPGAVLDAALLVLSSSEISKQPIPEADPTGAIRYPLLGTPDGFKAELWVQRTNNQEFGNPVLSLRLECAPPTEPYVVAGAARRGSNVTITAFMDSSTGQVRHFNILTDFELSSDNRNLGIPIDQARIPFGLLYNLDMRNPLSSTARAFGVNNGNHESREVPLTLVGGPWPREDGISQFGTSMFGMYHKLTH